VREYPEYPMVEYSECRYQLNAGVCCPITMTFAAAPALDAYANNDALNPHKDAPSLAQTLLAVRAAAAHVGALGVLLAPRHGYSRVLTHGCAAAATRAGGQCASVRGSMHVRAVRARVRGADGMRLRARTRADANRLCSGLLFGAYIHIHIHTYIY
jgi:hypothetical protein